MYCERCGKQIDESLNYCNSCGANLKPDPPRSQRPLAIFLISTLSVTVIIGLIVLAGLLAGLFDKVSRAEPLFVFAGFYLLVLFGISFLIMRQVSKLIDAELGTRDLPSSRKSAPAVQLPPRSTNQLDEFREPASVTDHTTRTLEKVPIDRN